MYQSNHAQIKYNQNNVYIQSGSVNLLLLNHDTLYNYISIFKRKS